MSTSEAIISQMHPDAESWTQFKTVVPPTPAELAMASVRWERRGLLGRLVRIN
jgi:hypothetical protein